MLHTDADLAVTVEGPIETHNVGGVAFMQHLQLSDNLVANGRLDFKVDQLRGLEEGGQKKTTQNKTQSSTAAAKMAVLRACVM